jgi:hypothetical protein
MSFDFLPLLSQVLFQGSSSQEGFIDQQGPLSSDRRHFLEFGLQERDPCRQGNNAYTHYTHYGIIIRIICIIYIIHLISIKLIISIILQVRTDLGIPEHVWQEKRSFLAASIDGFGDRFKPELRAGWLAYIRQNYPDGPVQAPDIMGDGTLEIDG